MKQKIENYFKRIGLGDVSEVADLIDGNGSNHLNYKVTTTQGAFVARITKPENLISYSNLSDEYTILKLVEKYDVGPKVIRVDLEYFDTPILIEEFIDGKPVNKFTVATEEMFDGIMDLFVKTSHIPVISNEFPFKFSYTTYQTDFRMWNMRLAEIEMYFGKQNDIPTGFRSVADSARLILAKTELLLQKSPKEFIYNDVHPGNIFWMTKENKAKFIDWQKVSTGDPVYMIALFARRFGNFWGMEADAFSKKVLDSYRNKKQIMNAEELFYSRILERAVSDMIWSVWAEIKKGSIISTTKAEENKYFKEAQKLLG